MFSFLKYSSMIVSERPWTPQESCNGILHDTSFAFSFLGVTARPLDPFLIACSFMELVAVQPKVEFASGRCTVLRTFVELWKKQT